jgi:hypothetical protein
VPGIEKDKIKLLEFVMEIVKCLFPNANNGKLNYIETPVIK